MTRTRTGDYKDPAAFGHRDRRQPRNGLFDVRAIPKKSGAGTGNWGVLGSEQEPDANINDLASSPPPDNKIAVIDAEAFSRLQNPSRAPDSNANSNTESSSSSA
ncbi:hypothetical protein BGW38_002861 [Lunasporangiospora selenospora]|uniref:Hyaluronan/mRNA-binding protein domain-containing protein n=1 Tax=Lunasporangiospora selenospora TaxID=979761 RepID=A0A9P6KD31_9FUNG|nr:hypothetical protein BGW38_002861 [Lunasporangiospora selenospora]